MPTYRGRNAVGREISGILVTNLRRTEQALFYFFFFFYFPPLKRTHKYLVGREYAAGPRVLRRESIRRINIYIHCIQIRFRGRECGIYFSRRDTLNDRTAGPEEKILRAIDGATEIAVRPLNGIKTSVPVEKKKKRTKNRPSRRIRVDDVRCTF